MSINKDSQKAPNLQFKGFTDDWEQRKFEDVIISIQTGTNLLGAESNHGIPLIKMGNIQRGFFSFKKVEFLKENEEVEERNMANFGDFLFNTRNTLELVGKGATWFGKNDKFAFNSNIARFTFEGINTIFFNYLYNTPQIIKQVKARAVGTTSVAAVYPKDLNSIKFWIPSENEQTKIGVLFRHLDNTITLHQRKLDQLNQLKAALLQQMFPGKGETVPKLRFAGFEGDWEERKLSEIGNTFTGLSGKTKEDFGHGEAEYIPYTNIFNNPITDVAKLESIEIDNKQNSVVYGDILFTTSSETPEEVGMSSVWMYEKENVYLNSFCFGFRPIEKHYPLYLAYLLRSPNMRKKFTILAQGISRYNISKNKVLELTISLPSISEQNKIGDTLKHLDDIITLQQRKLDQLKNTKQILLQNMFI